MSQLVPVNPVIQLHEYEVCILIHWAPFWQGSGLHKLVGMRQRSPSQPSTHVHVNVLPDGEHTPPFIQGLSSHDCTTVK